MSREQVLNQIGNLPDSSWNKLLEFVNQFGVKDETKPISKLGTNKYPKFFSYIGRINLDSDSVTSNRKISTE